MNTTDTTTTDRYFLKVPHSVLISGVYPSLTPADRQCLQSLMMYCYTKGPHELPLVDLARLTGLPASTLCDTQGKNMRIGVLSRLEGEGLITTFYGKRVVNGVAKGNDKFFILVHHDFIWERHRQWMETNEPIYPDCYRVEMGDIEVAPRSAEKIQALGEDASKFVHRSHNANRTTRNANRTTRNANEPVRKTGTAQAQNEGYKNTSKNSSKNEDKNTTPPTSSHEEVTQNDTLFAEEEIDINAVPLKLPDSSMKWSPEKLVQITEFLRFFHNHQGQRFSTKLVGPKGKEYSQRSKQLAAAKRLISEFKISEEDYVRAYTARNNEWWNTTQGSLTVEHMIGKTSKKEYRIIEVLQDLDSKSDAATSSQPNTSTKGGFKDKHQRAQEEAEADMQRAAEANGIRYDEYADMSEEEQLAWSQKKMDEINSRNGGKKKSIWDALDENQEDLAHVG